MEKSKRSAWSPQECQLLPQLVQRFVSKRWKCISQQFRQRGFCRSENECREKWVNFLAPDVNRQEWEAWQLKKLYEMHASVGTRWCQVQRVLRRSQNQIKNRFYGTLRNLIRAVLNHFDPARSASNCPVARLSPNYLNSLYNSTAQFQAIAGEIKAVIAVMGYRIDKGLLVRRMEEKKEIYCLLSQILLRDFSFLLKEQQPPPVQAQELAGPYFSNCLPEVNCEGLTMSQAFNHTAILTSTGMVFWYYY